MTEAETDNKEGSARMREGSASYLVYVLEIAPGALVPGLSEKLPSRRLEEGRQWFYVGITKAFDQRLDQHLRGEKAWSEYRRKLERGGKKSTVRPVQPFRAISELRGGGPLMINEDVLPRPDLISGGNRFKTKKRAERAEARTSKRLRSQGHEVFSDK